MKSLLDTIGSNSGISILIVGALLAVVLYLLFRLSARLSKIQATWSHLLSDTSTGNLELILRDHLAERLKLQSELEESKRRIAELESKMETAKRHLGLVRFDAFEDVGGSQSFALAIFDDHGNGAVLNGLIGRTDARVYCKPLVAGRSDRTLSQEESLAVDQATSSAPKSLVTP